MNAYEDDLFALAQSGECAVPGYVVLRLKPPGATLARLDAAAAGRLGGMLARAAAAVAAATGAERVYCLSFCEVDPQLHFHLFPRTRWLAGAFRAETGAAEGPIDGPALFEWSRRRYRTGALLPPGAPAASDVAERLGRELAP
jgi:diadenosine tetraphosphate (Ap4A) HIT family hydrolase